MFWRGAWSAFMALYYTVLRQNLQDVKQGCYVGVNYRVRAPLAVPKRRQGMKVRRDRTPEVMAATLVNNTAVSVEQNFNRVRAADDLLPPIVVRVCPSVKKSKSCAVFVSDCDSIKFSFALKVCETDKDVVALRNLDLLNLVDVGEITFGEVE